MALPQSTVLQRVFVSVAVVLVANAVFAAQQGQRRPRAQQGGQKAVQQAQKAQQAVHQLDLDFSQAVEDPVSGQLCVMQKVCLANPEALAKRLPQDSCFPPGCNCNSAADCKDNGMPFCANCTCSKFPAGCDCNSEIDCGGASPFCANCQCSRFPAGCDCSSKDDCGGLGSCDNCKCNMFRAGCSCNSDNDCGGDSPFCANCQCSRFPEGCDCKESSDCGGQGSCDNCKCNKFPPGCTCNSASDCGADKPNCNDCRCSHLPPGCNCENDGECGGGTHKCVGCSCKDCPVSVSSSNNVINPPLTFVVDTTKSVKPDKFSIFNLTQKVVDRIVETKANIPGYRLVTFNDLGPDFRQNVDLRVTTDDVLEFKQEIVALKFESFDGGRDSKERLMQGLLAAVQESPAKSLVVVFTDNGSKDLNLRSEILRIKNEKMLTVYIVLTPIFEGFPNDPSLPVYEEVSDKVFFIAEVGADVFLTSVQTFEETNCV